MLDRTVQTNTELMEYFKTTLPMGRIGTPELDSGSSVRAITMLVNITHLADHCHAYPKCNQTRLSYILTG
jgi:ribosomal protein S15P/S13E